LKKRVQEKTINVEDLPEMRCDDNCGLCCGITFASEKEYQKIKDYMKEHNVFPERNHGLTCCLYQNGRCAVYPVRPLLCRVFGHTEQLFCPKGYNVNVPDKVIRKLLIDNVDQSRSLFDLLFERDLCQLHEKNF
jgi:Fe-S-cluster containining protein